MNAAPAPHILVADDDRRIRELIRAFLIQEGFRVTAAASAGEARRHMEGLAFDLLILDIMMPGESGLDLTRALRERQSPVPILMLSALADTEDRIRGLMSGSDDYLPKPFEPRELLLRIQNVLRRVRRPETLGDIRFGPCAFNVARGELRKGGELVRLTTRERDILRRLARAGGSPLSRSELAHPGAADSARSVDVQINRLRQKIEEDPSNPIYLQTIRGSGYALHGA